MPSKYRKPPLTDKVLAGLDACLQSILAGPVGEGDTMGKVDEIHAAERWVDAMYACREGRKIEEANLRRQRAETGRQRAERDR